MEYTIKKLSQLASVSSRTLRYYDSINLLKPKRVNSSGYRIYGEEEIERLQQILFFRELELPLEEIKNILDDDNFDSVTSLKNHRKQLLAKRQQLDQLLQTIDKTLASKKGTIKMTDKEKFEGFKQKQLAENEEKYGEEIRERYGKETVEKSNKKFANLTEKQYNEMQEMAADILEKLKNAMKTQDIAGEEAVEVVELHKKWLTYTWPSYSEEAQRGLSDMYVMDERFRKYYDGPAGSGAAQFLRDAIYDYTQK
ncbi:MerR family transcriptional regulator [Jeotgalibaca ciconiae]|uniref:MerR family transcriptional regulator n=1 Tax=Jeotgalibaca ciconiae TaxID=2496265 RepID=A0A3Q9BKB9_9LACT|nr:MerR family transcriptional regulator [Jeotgalibaca ciconiae]AZP03870.1 MerR family transcriptional regulator [Jeotgalibaca ciconiae]